MPFDSFSGRVELFGICVSNLTSVKKRNHNTVENFMASEKALTTRQDTADKMANGRGRGVFYSV